MPKFKPDIMILCNFFELPTHKFNWLFCIEKSVMKLFFRFVTYLKKFSHQIISLIDFVTPNQMQNYVVIVCMPINFFQTSFKQKYSTL